MRVVLVPLAATALCALATHAAAQAEEATAKNEETIDTRIGTLTFESGYPSQETLQKLYDEMDFQRAAQAYI